MSKTENDNHMTARGLVRAFCRTFSEQKLAPFLLVFFSYFVAARFGESVFVDPTTSHFLIWAPAGIALAAVLIGGYRLWIPIACAQFIAALTSPTHAAIFTVIVSTIAQTLQPVIGAFFLNKLRFTGRFDEIREGPLLVGAAFFVPMVAPTITAVAQALFLPTSTSAALWTIWSRSFSAGVLSILIVTPLILSWYPLRRFRFSSTGAAESFVAFCVLVASNVFLSFFPSLTGNFGLAGFYLLLAMLFWIVLRMDVRLSTLAMFVVSAISMAGALALSRANTSVSQELLGTELTLEIIVVIVLAFVAIAEERRATMRKLQEEGERLRASMNKLNSEDRAKNEFIAILAHELRNPLSPVVSSLELLKLEIGELSRPDIAQLLDVAERHTRTVTKLLDDLLDISRISRRRLKLQKEPVDLGAAFARSRETVDAFYRSRNHALVVSLPEEPVWIEADPVRLEQIFINILFNAAKYTEPGGTVEVKLLREEGSRAKVSIRDNGIGIAPHMLAKIFEQFVQAAESVGAGAGNGLGIGLYLTKRLVELHGGEVWAFSEGHGKGSEFVVVLPAPLSIQLPLSEKPPMLQRAGKRIGVKKRAGKRVLIVDDNEAAASGLKKLLEHFGHTVLLAHDGDSAIRRARDFAAEVILLDIGLPDMDGYEVAQALRREHGGESFRLVALTGYGQEEDKLRAYQSGFDAHLTKPVGMADIEAIL